MARKSSKAKRASAPRPRPVPRAAPSPSKTDSKGETPAVTSAARAAAEQRLETMYAYVRKDLVRIAVLAALMIALIALSPLVF